MSRDAQTLMSPRLMEWCTGEPVLTDLSGRNEHVLYAGNSELRADILLIAPATANTIGKMAGAIDDGIVTTFATTAIGEGLPVIVVPAMHEPMYRHPGVLANIATIRGWGVSVLTPQIVEGKAKIAAPEDVVEAVTSRLRTDRPLSGRRIVVTAGRTISRIDPIRLLTNSSTGRMGVEIARAASERGAEVVLVAGVLSVAVPAGIRVVEAHEPRLMQEALDRELATHTDAVIAAAAVNDWEPIEQAPHKLPTKGTERLNLELRPTPKIIDSVRKRAPHTLLVAFRALEGMERDAMIADARDRMARAQADLICLNDVGVPGQGFAASNNELHVIDASGVLAHIPPGSKPRVADQLMDLIATRLARRGPA